MEIISGENKNWTRISDRNRMYMMVVDPHTLFAYWEISETTKHLFGDHFECQWEKLPLYLILRDVTERIDNGMNAPTVRQYRIVTAHDHWYFRSLAPQRHYVLDLATTTFTGQFFLLLRSNVVETPPLPSGTMRTPNFEWEFHALTEASLSSNDTNHAVTGPTSSEDYQKSGDEPLAVASPLQLLPYHSEFDGYSIIDRRAKA